VLNKLVEKIETHRKKVQKVLVMAAKKKTKKPRD
jgi:hypothetical protein